MFYKDMIQELFPKTPQNVLDKIENILINNCKRFAVNTPLRFAHFIAQVREEIGPEFKAVRENLNYTESSALKTFKNLSVDEAKKYARNENNSVANQVALADIVYANKLGNGDKDTNKNGRLDEDDDGWKFRGAGALQITGKYNFVEVQKRIDKYLDNLKIDIVNTNDINTLEGSLVAGLGFWVWKDLYNIADKGASDKVVDQLTTVINKYTHSYEKRKEHFNKIKHLIK